MRVIVVGAGVVGTTHARHAEQCGREVVPTEQTADEQDRWER
ncbi:hypothetical protein [Streptomyces sp. cg35]